MVKYKSKGESADDQAMSGAACSPGLTLPQVLIYYKQVIIIILRLTGKKEKRPVNRLCLNGFRVLLFVIKT